MINGPLDPVVKCPLCGEEMILIFCSVHARHIRWVHMGELDRTDCLLLIYENKHHQCFETEAEANKAMRRA